MRATSSSHSLAVILVNWNGWRDTVECLESLLPTLASDAQVIVCDNASQDQSLEHLSDWAHTKALTVTTLDRQRAESGGNLNDAQLVFVQTGANLGFAGGNNVGLRYAMKKGHAFFWLLNNDTTVAANSANAMITRLQQDPSIGMCGSTIYYHDQPDKVQCLAGSAFNFEHAVGIPLGYDLPTSQWPSETTVHQALQYISGASMMLSRALLEKVGLMEESYFLYFEEIDWAVRAKPWFQLGWAKESIVWHKEGGSIGSSHRSRPSNMSLRYLCENRLRFTRKHSRAHLGSVLRRLCYEALVYAKRRDWQAVQIHLKAVLQAHRMRH